MRDTDRSARLLKIKALWRVSLVEEDEVALTLTIFLRLDAEARLRCPMCGKPCPRYDHRHRRWRLLDTMQFSTIVEAEVPRVNCPAPTVSMSLAGSEHMRTFRQLRDSALKTADAWALKEHAMSIWDYVSRTWARKAWEEWIALTEASTLEPVRKVAGTIRNHLWGIVNAIVLRRTNAIAESTNARIQKVKARACGFRNRERFRTAIMFHLGQLDLLPRYEGIS